ncbi:[protein-PII] uridylyltransferase [Legionella israelensis]|uniref:[protein-PII] uridylyltransferase n=1 Tax=Legionella israelensis TaxID=454 RepID=UPI00117CA792|nr:[protein-PII] uridylyltransferase [Legionella israelensis]QDP72611.1 [protein-PII] uridylyltransferase [Legionella israelensis]
MKNDNRQLKKNLRQFKNELCNELREHGSIQVITRKLVHFIDELLIALFQKNNLHVDNAFCLIALGSYGRRELQLYSDIDLLLLHTNDINESSLDHAQSFIQDCWDIGLETSHQFTTVKHCADLASNDLSVISSIMDMHLLCGRANLMEELIYQTHPLHMWPSKEYFFAKQEEQNKRYKKYDETAYNLEPNVKNGPGGIRDLQILLSISKRHFNIKKLADGIYSGFILDKEYEELVSCQHFLWRVRFALHMLAGKKEDRLLFDHQIRLAEFFGYKDKPHSLAIEQFMKTYFKIIKRSRELNEMLLQWFAEVIIEHPKQRLISLDNEFQLSNHYIEAKNARVFRQRPHAILSLFLWIAKKPEIKGVRASSIRLIRQSLYLINTPFRNAKISTELFMNILKAEEPYEALQRMNRYGVLARYLDCFATVTGQMQYDLFHVYTVDQHTMFVIRNISRFKQEAFFSSFPLCSNLFPTLKKPEILYLAALFHDIAKGRNGDHSVLGAIEAEHFAQHHRLDRDNTHLLTWLVQNHLLMSITAQRKDIYDPKTITEFCKLMPHRDYLDYLYLLTVADICATNPKLWNAWKDSLLKELYHAANDLMKKEKASFDESSLITVRQQIAMDLLSQEHIDQQKVQKLWSTFKGKYFLHESPDVIVRHTKAILNCKSFPLILIMPHHTQGGTEIFIYMPHKDERFIITTTVLSNFNMTIQEASIITCDNAYDLDTYIILDDQDRAFLDKQKSESIKKALFDSLVSTSDQLPVISRKRISRAHAHFKFKPEISFDEDHLNQQTSLFLVTNDRPGLLARISRVFFNLKIHLHNAKIATAGERVEDTFYITNQHGHMLNQNEKEALKQELSILAH